MENLSLEEKQSQYQAWPKNPKKILFIIVMQAEAAHLIKDFKFTEFKKHKVCTIYKAISKNNKELYLIQGIQCLKYKVDPVGSDQASMLAQIGIDQVNPDIVISAGTCGGVVFSDKKDNVKQYDVCYPRKIHFIDREMILDVYKPFITGDYPILNPTKIYQKLGLKEVECGTTDSFTKDNSLARSKNVQIVEMEAAAESRTCYMNQVPFGAIKIISDVEMDDEQERTNAFLKFLQEGPQKLSDEISRFIEAIDEFAE